ncbi:MAG: 5-formyltetrahydrofolate cyclo-ligase [Cyclobacteriaceae bacterium]|nr:5-formyltetrahydrofolate cyclo-ligase [Cyclobacteriaceae bacterium]
MNKIELRKLYLEKRQALTEAEYLQRSHRICEFFFASIDLSFIKVLHTFLPITEKKEPDTWLIIDRIRREFPHIRLVVPRINDQQGELENFFFEGLHQLQKNKWGIDEPKQGVPAPPEKIDMVLVPLLAFDKHGNRVGYGKGYYDKFLSGCKPEVSKVGLSLFDPYENIPSDPFDVILTHCITSVAFYSFQISH